ncbi:MAG: pyridoxamine 5'-phosphate oxidase family protein [Desulfobacteraceae bacterium]|nr:MAG: pyridoxamine 5'-phosphate oxidase family protein [Desulfobacteraceae bacterium]
MSKEMRRKDRAITRQEAMEILSQGEYGVLSTSTPDGEPYGAPLNYCIKDDALYFHCALEGHKLANLAVHNRVSFCVVGRTEVLPEKFGTKYESVIISGKVWEVFDSEKQRALEGLVSKYSAAFMAEGLKYIEKAAHQTRVFKVPIENLSGKARK